ncbi:GntR family transcriptional regulator [Tabrizicola sp. BL-A-41-H6]|uniref:GntR family transcriptional regulator n=1 Tax=Tabrizicola sp. BL-A-41-H6 TaxID=3421107 RepID=UPI003D676A64
MTGGWEGVRAEVLRRIRARDWPPGGLIPNEETLAQEFNVARATVNRALRDLAEAGVIERKKRAGTRVAELPVRRARLDIPVIRQDVEAKGLTHAFDLLADDTRPGPVPVTSRLGLPEGTILRHLETLHLAGGRPYVLEDRWLNPAVLPDPPPDFGGLSANEWLVTNVSLVSGDITFTAEPATEREAAVLGIPPGTALFIAVRTTVGTLGPVTFVRFAHAPGHRVQMTF